MTIQQALVKLSKSKFRGRFKLNSEMQQIILNKGLDVIRQFAKERVTSALAPAEPPNDGHQTPLKGHPVFIAQHATATCCRNCLNHWWRVPKGIAMTVEQEDKVVNLIMAWIEMQMNGGIEELKKTMSEEDLTNIPFWRTTAGGYKCPYRK